MSETFQKTKVMKRFEEAMLFHGHRQEELTYDIATRRYVLPHIHHMFMGFMLCMHNRENQFQPYVIGTFNKEGEISFSSKPEQHTKLSLARTEAIRLAHVQPGKAYAIFGHIKSFKVK